MSTNSKLKHKQAPIIVDGEITFSVDVKLQSLIQFLWDNDIFTFNSCQHNVRDTCWIQYDLGDWLEMSEISFRSESQSLYQFIEDECEVLLLSSDDGYMDENDEYWLPGENQMWSASVRFHKKLIPDFEKIIRSTLTDSRLLSNTESV
jgi:hypothetical protein